MKKEGVSIIALLVNVLLAVSKILIGLISRSSAIIADGIHSGMDIVSSGISYIGIRASKKPVDKEHPYGHYKTEVVAGFIITVILFLTALWIIYESSMGLFEPTVVDLSYLAIGVVIGSVIMNEIMARVKMKYGKKYNSMALIADANHSRMDSLTSVGVLVGLGVSGYWIYADSVAAILIGIYVLWESVKLGRKTIDSLINISAGDEIEGKITKVIKSSGIQLWNLKTQKLGAEIFAELKIGLDPKLSVEKASEISIKLEDKLKKVIPQLKYVVIQIESHKITESFYNQGVFGSRKWKGRFAVSGGHSAGPGGYCTCTNPKCNNKVPHQKGVPCFKLKCQKCGSRMKRTK